MNRKFGIGILVLCFGLPSVHASLADQVIEISPIIVQPYDLREISQQMPEQDLDLKAKEESVRWLNQVVAVAKIKAEYYQLTSQQDRLTMEQAQQDKENQIIAMKTAIQSLQATQARADALRQQLADQQNKADLLKAELDSKNAQLDQMTLMMSDYQRKLESKDNEYNQELRQVLLARNEIYKLQELMSAKDKDAQAKDLSLSIELALARRQLSLISSSKDEQARIIHILVQKLQATGQSVNLTQMTGKS
jgi:hypothetical protein